jgi:hypothetical protein
MKPGYKTTEFWMSLAAVLIGGFMASGVFTADSAGGKVIALIAGVLGSLGYTVSRAWVKVGDSKAAAVTAAAERLPLDKPPPA